MTQNKINALGGLNAHQVFMVKRSWKHVHTKGMPTYVKRIFNALQNKYPGVAKAFQEVSCVNAITANAEDDGESAQQTEENRVCTADQHVTFLINYLDEFIENLESSNERKEQLQEFGEKHAHLANPYRITNGVWEDFGEIAMTTFTTLPGIHDNKEHVRVWRRLIAFISEEIRYGYERGSKKARRRGSYTNVGGLPLETVGNNVLEPRGFTHQDQPPSAFHQDAMSLGVPLQRQVRARSIGEGMQQIRISDEIRRNYDRQYGAYFYGTSDV